MNDCLISIGEASRMLGLSTRQLLRLDTPSKIPSLKTEGGHRRYRLSDIKARMGISEDSTEKLPVAVYCRVSSHDQKQKGDLDRQKARLLEHCVNKKYPVEQVFDEVGSGMNDSRSKLQLMRLVFERKISRVVIEHKDRLSRFNFNIFKVFFESYGVTIECVEDKLPK